MFSFRSWLITALGVMMIASPALARTHHWRYHYHHRYYRHYRVRHTAYERSRQHYYVHEIRGQRSMNSQRVEQIQAALIREHYLTGQPTGNWDMETQAAMRKFQSDHGWQTKLLPDSRALIMLGLGPKVDEEEQAKFNGSSGSGSTLAQPQPSISYADTLAAVHAIPE